MENIGTHFLTTVIKRFKNYKDLGDKTLAQLTIQQLEYQPNAYCNSITMIIQHMSGNMLSRWTDFLTTDGEKPWRERDAEFEQRAWTREAIIALWEKGWSCLLKTLDTLTEHDLLKTVTIRQEPLTVIDAINRQLAHYPYHVGQIVSMAKEIMGPDFSSLSIAKGESKKYNESAGIKDPAKRF